MREATDKGYGGPGARPHGGGGTTLLQWPKPLPGQPEREASQLKLIGPTEWSEFDVNVVR